MTNTKDDLQVRWWSLEAKLVERFGKKPDMETILFLIGIQEFGQIKEKFTKEEKQELKLSFYSTDYNPDLESVDSTMAKSLSKIMNNILPDRKRSRKWW